MLCLIILLGAMAGLGVYIFVINRTLSYLKDGIRKSTAIPSAFVLIVGGFVTMGYISWPSLWAWSPLLVLVGIGVGEVVQLVQQKKLRGDPPVSVDGPPQSLFRPVTTTDLHIRHYQVRSADWHGERLRVAHLSDLHVNETIPLSYYQHVIERLNQEEPDLVFITGDFVTEACYAQLLPGVLEPLTSRLGIYAVLGNHDYWVGPWQIAEIVSKAGIELLYNGWRRLEVGDGNEVLLMGCEAPWGPAPWSPPLVQADEFVLALSHTADNIYDLSRAGAKAVFSGHYHAGQFQVPGLGPLVVPSAYGRRFNQGHFVVNGTHLFVTAGAGVGKPVLRLYCPPDILIVDFV
ncbi:MAG: metallophosphoesterase [Chloroflexota bacterium]